MTGTEQRIAGLEQQVAELVAEVSTLRKEAFVIRTLEEVWAATSPACGPAIPPRRPRHLTVVTRGRS